MQNAKSFVQRILYIAIVLSVFVFYRLVIFIVIIVIKTCYEHKQFVKTTIPPTRVTTMVASKKWLPGFPWVI